MSRVRLVAGLLLIALPARAAISMRETEPEVTARTLAWCAAQQGRPKVWVFFTDKGVTTNGELAARLEPLRASLDPHAARRRAKVLGDARVDAHDLDVDARYVDQLRSNGLEVVRTSRWLNAVSVCGTLAELSSVVALPCVSKLVPVRSFRCGDRLVPRAGLAPTRSLPAHDRFDYGASRPQLAEIGVMALHAQGLSGAGVVIALLDTGFDWTHPALQHIVASGRMLDQYDFLNDDHETRNEPGDDPDQHAHGTIVWSVLAAFVPGQLIGPAHGASFLLAKTEDVTSETKVEEDHWIAASEWADARGADVISSSLIYTDWYTYPDMDGDTAPITIAADIAASRGIVVCSAAGNSGTDDFYYIGAPADGNFVIAVGATRPDGSRADFCSHGPTADGRIKPDVMARGDETWAAVPQEWGGGYRSFQGTSVACPLVAGAVSLMLEARPSLTPFLVWRALTATADQATHPDNDRGFGRIHVDRAVHGW